MMGDFSLLIGIGAALGLLQVARHAPPARALSWVDAGLYTLFGALIGSRCGYVFLHLSYFRIHPREAPQIWLGGLSWPGALLGGLLVVILVAAWRELPLALVAGRLAPLAIPIAACAWMGSWYSGAAYGPLMAAGTPFALLTPMENGLMQLRLPVQLMAALSLLAFLTWIELKSMARERPGRWAALNALVLSGNLLVFSLLRADPAPLWDGLRADAWAALLFTGLSMLAFAAAFWPFHRQEIASDPIPVSEQP